MLVKECQGRINSYGEAPVEGRRSAKVKSDEGTGLVGCFHAGSRSYRRAAKSEWAVAAEDVYSRIETPRGSDSLVHQASIIDILLSNPPSPPLQSPSYTEKSRPLGYENPTSPVAACANLGLRANEALS